MGERPDQIERQIAETRSELSDNFSELQDKVKSAVDWRTQFQEHPGTLLAVAFGGGVVLSALLPSPRRSRKTYDSGTISAADRTYSVSSYDSSSAAPGKPSDLRKTIEALTGALLGVAVNQASGFLDSVLPGFPASTRNSPRPAPARTRIRAAIVHQLTPPPTRPRRTPLHRNL